MNEAVRKIVSMGGFFEKPLMEVADEYSNKSVYWWMVNYVNRPA